MKENDIQTLKFTCVVRDHRESSRDVRTELDKAFEDIGSDAFDFEVGIDDNYVTFVGNHDVMTEIDKYRLFNAFCIAVQFGPFEEEDGVQGVTLDGDCVIVEGKDDEEIMARVAFVASLEW